MKHHGCLLKVSKDGSHLDCIASGLRAANGMSIGPNGEITTADNEGTWVPTSRINLIQPGGFYGCPPLSHTQPPPTAYAPPICWIPHEGVDNSSGGQVWVTSNRFGPLEGSLLHMSYGMSSLFLVMHETMGGLPQGGVVKLPLQFRTGIMRGRFNPRDGQLYVCGVRGWQTTGLKWGALQRVRYTGGPVYLPRQVSVTPEGVAIAFTTELDKSIDPDDFKVEQWNYRWSSNYGSKHYLPGNPDKVGEEPVDVKDATLLPDKKTVLLRIPNLKPVMQMRIRYKVKSADGVTLKQEIFNTINAVPQ
jgi:hypothetical protein